MPTVLEPLKTVKKFFVMHQWSWGTGATLDEATKISRQQGGRGKRLLALSYDGDKTTNIRVDDMGRILYTGDKPEEIK